MKGSKQQLWRPVFPQHQVAAIITGQILRRQWNKEYSRPTYLKDQKAKNGKENYTSRMDAFSLYLRNSLLYILINSVESSSNSLQTRLTLREGLVFLQILKLKSHLRLRTSSPTTLTSVTCFIIWNYPRHFWMET